MMIIIILLIVVLLPQHSDTFIVPSATMLDDGATSTNGGQGSDRISGSSGGQRLHLIAFANRIIRESCVSIETALLAGWSYNLLTKFTATNASRAGANGEKTMKLYAYKGILGSKHLDGRDLILFVDAYDVIFQGSAADFVASISGRRKRVHWDLQRTIVYNAEDFCHPFVCCSASYRCPLTQGVEYLSTAPHGNNTHTPHACNLQMNRAPKETTYTTEKGTKRPVVFLNSGVSLGSAATYRTFIDRSIAMVAELPSLCHDDQGIVAWMYAKDSFPITLDYASSILATSQVHVLKDYKFDNATGMWRHRNGAAPYLVHFAGSKRAYQAYRKYVYNWYKRSMGGGAAIRAFFENKTVTIDGVNKPFYSVCPEEQTSLWSTIVSSVDTVLKRTGLSPVKPPPAECPEEFCPRYKMGPLPEADQVVH